MEKILRTLAVYLGLAIIMRLAGKRQLAQLNSFDLIVMLLVRQVRRTGLSDPEVVSALRHQGANAVGHVRSATLEPGGSISVELTREAENATYGELRQAVLDLQRHLDERLSGLDRGDRGTLGGDGVPG